ncbi:MAG: TOBE domain-containing protein, partial [Mycobacteriaceae bacterium]
GRVEQVGPPQEIYTAPATTYVAGFLGAANIFDAHVLECTGATAVCSAMSARLDAVVDNGCAPGPAAVVIRPERMTVQLPHDPVPAGYNAIAGTVAEVVYLGASTQVHVDVGESAALVVDVPNHSGPQSVGYRPGLAVSCVCAPDAVRVLHRSPATVAAVPAGKVG